jgi:hypothetical protein
MSIESLIICHRQTKMNIEIVLLMQNKAFQAGKNMKARQGLPAEAFAKAGCAGIIRLRNPDYRANMPE